MVGLFRLAPKFLLVLLFFAAAGVSHAQVDPVVCSAGSGNFETTFRTGVKIEVGAARRDGLAVRMCQGTLSWDKSSLVVATSAFEVDIDALGVDLGFGTPVVTFQVKQAEADCCRTLLIYSLQKPPKLLRTIAGGGSYSTADRNLNGELEIWTSDASSMTGFEGPAFRQPEAAPVAVVGFVHGRLLDLGSEFQNYFDEAIATDRSKLTPDDLRAFKESDGRLAAEAHSPEEQQRAENLQRTKVRAIQIVWDYLYSGREPEAWKALAELWPAADFERIKAEIIRARGQGVLSHVDGTSTARRPTANTAKVFDLRTRTSQALPTSGAARRGPVTPPLELLPALVLPVPIFVAHLVSDAASEKDVPAQGMLDLTIDAGGKVHSAHATDPALDAWFKDDTPSWKFIPAMNQGEAVASRIYLVLTPER